SFILNLPSHHSITSSARASSVGGTSRPRALAVVRLMTRSNLVGCSTGMSAGLAPRKILLNVAAPKNPIVGSLADCCARAASGHDAAATPSSLMNARRFITRSPRRRAVGLTVARRDQALRNLEVRHQLESGRLQDRQVGWLGALEDLADIGARLTIGLSKPAWTTHLTVESPIGSILTRGPF